MGYYVNAHGTIEMPRSMEIEAVHALKMLNYRHELKRGGMLGHGAPDDPFRSKWFSWVPERYHEDPSLNSVASILDMVGFTNTRSRMAGLNVYTVNYDNKTGQEEVFLNVLADYAQIRIEAVGEDGTRWLWVNAKAGAPLEYHEALITYRKHATVMEMVEQEMSALAKIGGQYA